MSEDPNLRKAKETVYRLLKYRPRSEEEIRRKLKLKKFTDDVVEQTVEYFKKYQFIDDRLFARSWVKSRLHKPLGLTRIRFELRTKGVAEDIIKEELDNFFDPETEFESVLSLARRRMTKYKNVEPLKRKRRLFEYLARRGFNSETIQKVLRKL